MSLHFDKTEVSFRLSDAFLFGFCWFHRETNSCLPFQSSDLPTQGGLAMERFVSEEKENFELDLLLDRESVNFLKDRGDVVIGASVGEQANSRVLDVQFIENF